MPTDLNTEKRLTRMETHLERLVTAVEKTQHDQEGRLRTLEEAVQKMAGVLGLIKWLGAPLVAAIVLFAGKFQGH